MNLDWDALERIEMTSWLLRPNDVMNYSIVIHGRQSKPNPEALLLARQAIEHVELFLSSARTLLGAFIKPSLLEDGISPDSFHFDDYGNSFWIYFNLVSDTTAHWKVRIVRLEADGCILDYRPQELARLEQ